MKWLHLLGLEILTMVKVVWFGLARWGEVGLGYIRNQQTGDFFLNCWSNAANSRFESLDIKVKLRDESFLRQAVLFCSKQYFSDRNYLQSLLLLSRASIVFQMIKISSFSFCQSSFETQTDLNVWMSSVQSNFRGHHKHFKQGSISM